MAFWKKRVDEVLLDATKIDIIALAPESAFVQLFITHGFPWTGSDQQLQSLREKVHTYVGYALDGQMAAEHPEFAGLPWRIAIVAKEPPDERTTAVIADIAQAVRRYGGDLTLDQRLGSGSNG